MATIEELKDVLKDTLDERGVLNQIRAQIRAEIFKSLNDNAVQKKSLSQENQIINELLRDYFIHNDYLNTKDVFISETQQGEEVVFKRNEIAKKLRYEESKDTRNLPLLYGLVFGTKKTIDTNELNNNSRNQIGGDASRFGDQY